MAKVFFTTNIQRQASCPEAQSAGTTVREVLDGVFAANPEARSYVFDDGGTLLVFAPWGCSMGSVCSGAQCAMSD